MVCCRSTLCNTRSRTKLSVHISSVLCCTLQSFRAETRGTLATVTFLEARLVSKQVKYDPKNTGKTTSLFGF